MSELIAIVCLLTIFSGKAAPLICEWDDPKSIKASFRRR